MPRKYIRKTPRPTYTQEDLAKAVNDILNRNRTYNEVEDTYGIPKSVVFHRIKGRKVPIDKMGAGRPPNLLRQVETDLENCLKAKARMGYPCNKDDIKTLVGEYVRCHNLKTQFKKGIPGDDWYYSFMRRHPSLSFKKPEHLQKSRMDARDPFVIYDFFNELDSLVNDNGLSNKPYFVFNCDESGFSSDPKRLKAIGEKGKPLSRISGGSGRESTTVLATVSADGFCFPPLIIFKGVAVQARWTSEMAYPGTMYSCSSNGWMEEPQFFEWFSVSFIPHVKIIRQAKDLPDQAALLMYDGHGSHISYRIVKAALDNNIHLLKFPSHLTDKMQPLDKCVFGPVKTSWDKKLISFGKRQLEKQQTGRLSKREFVELLGEVWKESIKRENVIKGFISTGTFPVDRTKFPENEFNPMSLKRYKDSLEDKENGIMGDHSVSADSNSKVSAIGDKACIPNVNIQQSPDEPSSSSSKQKSKSPLSEAQVHSTPMKQPISTSDKSSELTPTGIINLFAKKLSNSTLVPANSASVRRQVVPRLKPVKYGEILTTEQVLKKLEEAEQLKNTKKGQKKSRKKQKLPEDAVEDEMEDESHLCQNSSDDDNLDSIIVEGTPEVHYEKPEWVSLKTGQFVLVDFVGGHRNKNHYKYVCCIQQINYDDGDIGIQGYQRHNDYSTEFTEKYSDVCTIQFEMIQAILPDPIMRLQDRKMIYVFPGSVAVFEK